MLDGRAKLPVVRTHAPAAKDVGIDGRGVGIGITEIQVVAPERRAQVAAGGEVVLQRRIQQVAIDLVVGVSVGPAAGRAARTRTNARDDARGRIIGAVDAVRCRRFEVPAEVHLERGLPVAEQVVGEPEPRCDVVVAANADRSIEADRLRVEARCPGGTVAVRRRPAPRAIVPHGALQRQAADRPLVLCVQADRLRAIVLIPARRQEVRDADGHLVVECVPQLCMVRHASVVHGRKVALVANLHVVRAGDVGQGPAPRRLQGIVVVEAEVERIEHPAIGEIWPPVDAPLFRHRNQVHQPVRRRHAEPRVAVGEPRIARFEQHSAADRS